MIRRPGESKADWENYRDARKEEERLARTRAKILRDMARAGVHPPDYGPNIHRRPVDPAARRAPRPGCRECYGSGFTDERRLEPCACTAPLMETR